MLKEATTLLELALWKADLNEKEEGLVEREGVRTTRGRRKRARKEICITSGASIVIKNVLPFLELKLVIRRIDHYKTEHNALLKETTTLLELALWKANLDGKENGVVEREGVRFTRGSRKRAKLDMQSKNVLPFLELK
eukprot:scaffold5329_cov126-Skeletonema_marinoi.AAC.10